MFNRTVMMFKETFATENEEKYEDMEELDVDERKRRERSLQYR